MIRSNLPTIPSTISVSSRKRRATTLRRRHDASPGTADSNLDRSVSGKMWLDWWSASHDQCHRKSGKVGKGEGRRYIQISWRKLRITGVRKRSVRTRRGEVRGIKYPGGGPVFSSDSASRFSLRSSVRTSLDYSIKEDEKFSGTRYEAGRVVSREHGGGRIIIERARGRR